MYVPILLAIGVIGGVGILTASLGNVMDEEALLGLQSGARAKKERDRNHSSYFKKVLTKYNMTLQILLFRKTLVVTFLHD